MLSKEYLQEYKQMLFFPSKYPSNFELMYKFAKNRLECNENSLFKLKYGLSLYKEASSDMYKNMHRGWPLFTIKQYNILIDLYLELIGFKKHVKDYVLICGYSLVNSKDETEGGEKKKVICFYADVLFDKPDFFNNNEIYLENDYFNEKLFNIQSETSSFSYFYWRRLDEFTDEFFYRLYLLVDSGVIIINNELNINDLKKVKDDTLLYLKELYAKRKESLFSGGASRECLHGYCYYTEPEVLSGKYVLERRLSDYISFFNVKCTWIDFVLGWENQLFNDSKIVSSDLTIDFEGNCKYLLESKG